MLLREIDTALKSIQEKYEEDLQELKRFSLAVEPSSIMTDEDARQWVVLNEKRREMLYG